MVQLTKLLGNVALAEFVVLAGFALWQWRRSRIRGAGWAAVSFLSLAGIGLVGKGMKLGLITPDQVRLKMLVGVLLVVPYAFYRFAAAFDRPPMPIRFLAGAPHRRRARGHVGIGLLPAPGLPPAAGLRRLPGPGHGPVGLPLRLRRRPPVGGRPGTGRHGPPADAAPGRGRRRPRRPGDRGRGRPHQVSLGGAPQRHRDRPHGRRLLSRAGPPADPAAAVAADPRGGLQEAMADLVRATSAEDVAGGLLPHVAGYVGAYAAAVLDAEGNPIATYGAVPDGAHAASGNGLTDDGLEGEASVKLRFGQGGSLVVWTSRYVPFFGRDELRLLTGLGDLIGLALERCTLAEREREAEKALARQALHDGLTGLPNRVLFADRLERALAGIERRQTTLAVMFVDLDRFKLINDGMDHAAGDAVLVASARRWRRHASRRHRRPLRRRRVRRPHRGDRRRRGAGAGPSGAAGRRHARPRARAGTRRDGQRRRGPSTRRAGRPGRRCCATPTPPCTGPRTRAATGWSSSARTCASGPSRSWSSNGPCGRRSAPVSSGWCFQPDHPPRRREAFRRRGAGPLAASATGPPGPPAVHPHRRGVRPDRGRR